MLLLTMSNCVGDRVKNLTFARHHNHPRQHVTRQRGNQSMWPRRHKSWCRPRCTMRCGNLAQRNRVYSMTTPLPDSRFEFCVKIKQTDHLKQARQNNVDSIDKMKRSFKSKSTCRNSDNDELEQHYPAGGFCCGGKAYSSRSGTACCGDSVPWATVSFFVVEKYVKVCNLSHIIV